MIWPEVDANAEINERVVECWLAGWRSRDGQLHDYYFPFVNGIAEGYGLIDGELTQQVIDRTLAEMDKVGYRDFSLGLPGNLIPIRRADYVDLEPRWGGPAKEDGSDGFQIYENGGATACFACFTSAALYKLGDKEHSDRMLLPMLEAFARQDFSVSLSTITTLSWQCSTGREQWRRCLDESEKRALLHQD